MMNLKRSTRQSTRVASPCPDGFRGIDPFLLQRNDVTPPAAPTAKLYRFKTEEKLSK